MQRQKEIRPSISENNKGFTLVELLVVIAIIGILAGIMMVSLNSAREKARDVKRRTTLKQLQTAIELYYNDNGHYPATNGVLFSSEPADTSASNNGGDWIPGLVPNYISALPKDPSQTNLSSNADCRSWGWHPAYLYFTPDEAGSTYFLLAHCSPEGSWTSNDPFYDPIRPTWAWKVCVGIACGN